jgi:hypothetical protein
MEDLTGFRTFLRLHTSWTYETIYDAYMIGTAQKALERIGETNCLENEEAYEAARTVKSHKEHLQSIIARIQREA